MKDFKALQVWQRSHQFTLAIYATTKTFPKEEIFGLTSQIRRSSTFIPSNIAEGCGRDSEAELLRFMVIAMGSSSELDYQLMLAKDLDYVTPFVFASLSGELTEIRKMLNALIQKLKANR